MPHVILFGCLPLFGAEDYQPDNARHFITITPAGISTMIPNATFNNSHGIGTSLTVPMSSQVAHATDPSTRIKAADFLRRNKPTPRRKNASAGIARGFRSRPPIDAVCQLANINETQTTASSNNTHPIILSAHISMTSTCLLHVRRCKNVRV